MFASSRPRHRRSDSHRSRRFPTLAQGSKIALVALALGFSPALSATGNDLAVHETPWNERNITVDGIGGEWKAQEKKIKGTKLKVATSYDDEFLYVSLSTENAALQRQILRSGLILWLENDASPPKSYGLHFPMPIHEYREQLQSSRSATDGNSVTGQAAPRGFFGQGRSRGERPSLEAVWQRLTQADLDVDVLQAPGESLIRVLPGSSDAAGLETAMDYVDERWNVEYKIPLNASAGEAETNAQDLLAVHMPEGEGLRLGVEIPAMERGRGPEGRGGGGFRGGGLRGGGGPGGGFGAAGGGRGGFGGGPRGGGGRGPRGGAAQEPVEAWIYLEPSSNPESTSR